MPVKQFYTEFLGLGRDIICRPSYPLAYVVQIFKHVRVFCISKVFKPLYIHMWSFPLLMVLHIVCGIIDLSVPRE